MLRFSLVTGTQEAVWDVRLFLFLPLILDTLLTADTIDFSGSNSAPPHFHQKGVFAGLNYITTKASPIL